MSHWTFCSNTPRRHLCLQYLHMSIYTKLIKNFFLQSLVILYTLKLINIALFLIIYCFNSEVSCLIFRMFLKILHLTPFYLIIPHNFLFLPACFCMCCPSLHIMPSSPLSPLIFLTFTKNTHLLWKFQNVLYKDKIGKNSANVTKKVKF